MARAQEFFNAYYIAPYVVTAHTNAVSGYALRSALFPDSHDSAPGRSRRSGPAPSTKFQPGHHPNITLRNMAALVPAQQQSVTYDKLQLALLNYRKIEDRLHLPKNDVASGVAAFIAGNYMAYHNTSIPDAAYLALVQQMRTVLLSNDKFSQVSNAQKQTLYEQLASIGMYMVSEQYLLSQRPNAGASFEMRKASKQAFESFFKMSIERIRITRQGVIAAD